MFLWDGDCFSFVDREVIVYFVLGYIRGYIVYYFVLGLGEIIGDLFCGDIIFVGGCGWLFEGIFV